MPELRWILIVAGLLILLAVYWWGRRVSPRAEETETIVRSRAEPLISSPALEPLTPDPYINEAFSIDPDLKSDAPSFATDPADSDFPDIDEPISDEPSRREPLFQEDPEVVIDADDEPTITPAEAASPAAEVEAPAVEIEAPAPAATPTTRRPRSPTPRKILVLRLAAGPTRIPGDKLRAAFAAQGMTFGKYEIFHRIHPSGETLFSAASMVEPGSFDLARMDSTPFPGVTLFAQLPSCISGQEVLEELLRHAKELQGAVGGTLQDERGGLLNSPRIQRLRDEVDDFEQLCSTHEKELAETPATR
ncbi:MAG: cell division protein ZipA C-terminal FtsZ-binding domain-containing protein [Steroidobacteraceae bacterium]